MNRVEEFNPIGPCFEITLDEESSQLISELNRTTTLTRERLLQLAIDRGLLELKYGAIRLTEET